MNSATEGHTDDLPLTQRRNDRGRSEDQDGREQRARHGGGGGKTGLQCKGAAMASRVLVMAANAGVMYRTEVLNEGGGHTLLRFTAQGAGQGDTIAGRE